MRFVLSVLSFCAFAGTALAQDQSLADIRQEMSVLYTEVQKLKTELSTTAGANVNISGDTLQRVDAIEAALARQTAKIEQLENRINRVVSDGTNRIGDLEFRLCELETGCDIATLGETSTLGGGAATPTVPSVGTAPDDGQAELAIGERSDFERAEEALASGDFRSAADQFAAFTQAYPGGPLSADAHFMRGEALGQLGEWNTAARAYLESFSGHPSAPRAPEALYKLGLALNELGQTTEACLMLQEVSTRYPSSEQVPLAGQSRQSLGCS
jgi:tol-pal system protein YbgF